MIPILPLLVIDPPALSTTGPSEANYKYLSALLVASDADFTALVDPKSEPKSDPNGNLFKVKPNWSKGLLPKGDQYPETSRGRPLPIANSYIQALPGGTWQYVDEIKCGAQTAAEENAANLDNALAETFKGWNSVRPDPIDHNVEPLYVWTATTTGTYVFTIAAAKPDIHSGWVVRLEMAHTR